MSDGIAGFAGLQSCGSPWACPVCSAKIAPVRAGDIQKAVDEWHARGNTVVFVTMTMRHNTGQKLSDLWDGLSGAWGKVTSGSSWERDSDLYGGQDVIRSKTRQLNKVKFKVETPGKRINFIRAVEVTHGDNGWHVHVHAYLFCKPMMSTKEVAELQASMFGRWRRALVNSGFDAPTVRRGVDAKIIVPGSGTDQGDYLTKNTYDPAAYAAKVLERKEQRKKERRDGWELAGGMGKLARRDNRSPFEILADVVALGDADDLARWFVFEQSSKGRRQITWSHGFREYLNLPVEELTDEEIAAREAGGAVVMEFYHTEWQVICWHKARVLKLVELGCSKVVVLKIIYDLVKRS
eukprot:gnl/Spiro4/5741_TR2938_c0_g2_i2.p2 gnl/Spiro4/5741_TR2938_c0_g2~~gnl/Spiro4/5741_TR2938_c0_g2_i2.p2  ORF type:complete len:351 (+),score=56.60 gnl/Spiro4/5741_TR2938_c0_g2_i2:4223-5275(+)